MITSVAPPEELAAEVDALTGRLRKLSPSALAGTKSLLNNAWQTTLAEALEAEIDNQVAVIASPEAQAAIAAFVRRP